MIKDVFDPEKRRRKKSGRGETGERENALFSGDCGNTDIYRVRSATTTSNNAAG